MCSSKPKIPDNKTPPAPLAPEPAPDAPTIGSRERENFYRSRGLLINKKPDLSGLGNQVTNPAIEKLLIGVTPNRVYTQGQIDAAANASAVAAANKKPVINQGYKGGGR